MNDITLPRIYLESATVLKKEYADYIKKAYEEEIRKLFLVYAHEFGMEEIEEMLSETDFLIVNTKGIKRGTEEAFAKTIESKYDIDVRSLLDNTCEGLYAESDGSKRIVVLKVLPFVNSENWKVVLHHEILHDFLGYDITKGVFAELMLFLGEGMVEHQAEVMNKTRFAFENGSYSLKKEESLVKPYYNLTNEDIAGFYGKHYYHFVFLYNQLEVLVGRNLYKYFSKYENDLDLFRDLSKKYTADEITGILAQLNKVAAFFNYSYDKIASEEEKKERISDLQITICDISKKLEEETDEKIQGLRNARISVLDSFVKTLKTSTLKQEILATSSMVNKLLKREIDNLDYSDNAAVADLAARLIDYRKSGVITSSNGENVFFYDMYNEFFGKAFGDKIAPANVIMSCDITFNPSSNVYYKQDTENRGYIVYEIGEKNRKYIIDLSKSKYYSYHETKFDVAEYYDSLDECVVLFQGEVSEFETEFVTANISKEI